MDASLQEIFNEHPTGHMIQGCRLVCNVLELTTLCCSSASLYVHVATYTVES